jgi:hypothetical protein
MLQNLPTQNWSDSEIGVLVAEAYRLKFTFADAPNHLQSGERWPGVPLNNVDQTSLLTA